MKMTTVDREIFTLKIICAKKFRVDKFSRFRLILEIFCVKCFICMLNFHGWSQLRNYFNSVIFPIYSIKISGTTILVLLANLRPPLKCRNKEIYNYKNYCKAH